MNTSEQKLVSDNIGMRYFAKFKRGIVSQVTHLAMYAQSTDALLAETKGTIAYMVNDTGSEVVATLITSKSTDNVAYAGALVGNFSNKDRKNTPLYVEVEKSLYQVTYITASVDAANAHMAANDDVALIDTIKATKETPELFVVAMLKTANH